MIYKNGDTILHVEYCGELLVKCSGRRFYTYTYKDEQGITHGMALDSLDVCMCITAN